MLELVDKILVKFGKINCGTLLNIVLYRTNHINMNNENSPTNANNIFSFLFCAICSHASMQYIVNESNCTAA